MNNPSVTKQPSVEVVQEEKADTPSLEFDTTTMAVTVSISLLFTLTFLSGAAYLSYQRNQSFLWAVLHFFFAAFYYPYYAFTQPSPPVETPMLSNPFAQTAGKRLKKMLTKRK